jgi:hypothetical protein
MTKEQFCGKINAWEKEWLKSVIAFGVYSFFMALIMTHTDSLYPGTNRGNPLQRKTVVSLRYLIPLLAVLLQGCFFVPVTTEVYDPGCRIMSKQMELQPVQVAALGNCRGEQCAAILTFMGATAAASAVVSGSIVVTGNVVYWFEKQGHCDRREN